MWQNRLYPLMATVLTAVFVITAALSVNGQSTTWDEPWHLTGGVVQLQQGDPRFNYDHPPLARLIGALPSVLMDLGDDVQIAPAAWEQADLINAPNTIFGTIEDRLLAPGRLMMLIFSVLLCWMVYAWGTRLFGPQRALLPLALLVFCPPMLANAPLVTTDMAATSFIFASFYTWWRYLQEPSCATLRWVCLAVVAALCTKFTAMLMVPLFLLTGLIAVASDKRLKFGVQQRLWIVGGGLLAISLVSMLGINLIYFFDGVFLTPPEYAARVQGMFDSLQTGSAQLSRLWPAWLPVPLPFTYVCGLMTLFSSVGSHGHWTYFLGEASNGGWPNFFFMLFLVKLPLPTLLLIGLGLAKACQRLPREGWNLLFIVSLPLLLFWTASQGKIQIGLRHILPALPFLFLLAGYCLPRHLNFKRVAFVGTMVACSAVSVVSVYPYFLMYFNFLGGGPEQGWRISINGDDWAQSDAELVRWLRTRGIKEVAYGGAGWSNGTVSRAGIGIKRVPCQDTGELVAIHAYTLLTPVTSDQYECLLWMRLRPPDEKIGYNIFLYNSKNVRPSAPANQALFSKALDLQLNGQLKEAIPIYKEYLKQEPDYFQAHFNLACALMDIQQCPAAIPEFERTLELWPGYKEAHMHLAKCYAAINREDKSQEHLQIYKENP